MKAPKSTSKPLVLMILDGWGSREPAPDNAITSADTPCWDSLQLAGTSTHIQTSGEAVGLPPGQMGNSEVGHMNIGAGRVVYQDYTRISQAIRNGSFSDNPALRTAIDECKDGALHIMGLLSPGGVHSHTEHFLATAELAAQSTAQAIYLHAFLDGRDTPPRSAAESIDALQQLANQYPRIKLATLCGRYYAMDRDQRWPRIELAYQALVEARAEHQADQASSGLQAAYARDESDEFVLPTVLGNYPGMQDGDSVIFINFRADRARQLTQAFTQTDFSGFTSARPLRLKHFVCMTEYQTDLPVSVAFPPETMSDLFGEIVANAGLRQLRIAETEKYAHVTFFFNGGREQPYPGEDRELIPSPKVATYDLQPEMSAPELGDKLAAAILAQRYEVIICNVANPDMVGHSGNFAAAVAAVEAVDACLAKVKQAIDQTNGILLISADHGNVEQMQDPASGQRHTAHTTNQVPFVLYGTAASVTEHGLEQGALRDIAPTMLHLLGLPQPAAMTGQILIKVSSDSQRSVA